MNDRLKFRAWDRINNKWLSNKNCIEIGTGYLTDFFDVEQAFNRRYVLMQCTGLKDKNSKLIYEGDVVKTSSYRCNLIVTWFKNKFILVPYSDYQDKDKYASERINGYRYFENNDRYANERDEVIGNIYENPELLKECK